MSDTAPQALAEATRALQRASERAFALWSDAVRDDFERRYIEPTLTEGLRSHRELEDVSEFMLKMSRSVQ